MIGKTISHYEIIEKLGEGGMGEVYLADDLKLERQVAIKFLPQHLTKDKDNVERFEREAKAAASLNHPNIVTIYEIAEENDQTFIVMEYVEGQTLREMLNTPLRPPLIGGKSDPSPIPSSEFRVPNALNIITQIAEGLSEAHKADIIHRDIKPENILIDSHGRVKILDFGLAKLKGVSKLTKETSTLGTIHYMSPEQLQGKEVDNRSDIWSLGVVLYEMFTGEVPFKGEYEQAVIYSILNDEPESVNGVSVDIQNVVRKALAKNPDLRYDSIEDVISGLKRVADQSTKPKKRLYSIAVLSFANMSADPDQEYFCDGIAEEIINALTHIDNLSVIARTSAFSFKGKNVDVREIGKKLAVENLLEGSVRKSGKQIRINAQLIDANDGSHIWSERYDRNMDDIFAIQDEISLAIVDKLKVELGEREKESIEKRYTDNIEAYNHYLKGRYFWNMRTEKSLDKAIAHFQEALQKDDTYALAYAGLADAYNLVPWYSSKAPGEVYSMAKNAALKALEFDDTLAEAHISLAFTLMFYDWDWSNSEKEFKKGIELKRGYASGHHWYFEYLVAVGQLERAMNEIKLARELDPLSLIINSAVGWGFYFNRRYNEAIEQSQKTLEMDPDFFWAQYVFRISCLQKSKPEVVIESFHELPNILQDHPLMKATLGSAYALVGNKKEAEKLRDQLNNLSKQKYISPCIIAMIHLCLQENDRALELLENAFEERDFWLVFLDVEPLYDSIRSKPAFTALLGKIGLK